MKNLVLCMSGLVLLSLQLSATQTVAIEGKTPEMKFTSPATVAHVKVNKAQVYVVNMPNEQVQDADDPMKTKSFSKAFGVTANDRVSITNQYGSITIKTWDKNEVKLDASIKAYAKTNDEAQELLNTVTIETAKDGDQVVFKTIINQRDKRWNWGSGSRNGVKWRREVKVLLTVYMPATNALNASQAYGSILMDDFSGPTSLKVQYGSLTGGQLSNANNYISAQYSATKFSTINQATISQQYGSGLTIGSIGTLDLNAQYTGVDIATIKNSAKIKQQYGRGVSIGTAGMLDVNAQYATIKVNSLKGNLNSSQQYGKLIVDQIEASAKTVQINTSYSTVTLGFANDYHGDFDINTNHASFSYGSNVTARKSPEERSYSSSKNYSGQIGKGGANRVSARVNYNGITFK